MLNSKAKLKLIESPLEIFQGAFTKEEMSMCDDNFDDNIFGGDNFMENNMDDNPEPEEDIFDVDYEPDAQPDETAEDEFTAEDAFFIGAMGFAYEEGLRKRYLLKKMIKK